MMEKGGGGGEKKQKKERKIVWRQFYPPQPFVFWGLNIFSSVIF